MKRIGFRVEVPEWHFYEDRRRWIYDLTDPGITEDAWEEGRVVAFIDAEGYFERPDQFDPLPAGSWRRLPFQYFERASDIPIGHVEIERLVVAFGTDARRSKDGRREGLLQRLAQAIVGGWRRLFRHAAPVRDVLFLRLVVLTPFEKRPAKKHDFRIDAYEPGEPMP
ncbi:hypothetical protein L2Y94_13990 [Luteibacter aegosomatis]|uniref:hypothetical protein n=1 Tax=Luteibacter aegosomatis TaxID=2911537 RepID=UPI001FF74200|nr:hypothetical protein [Luteibacter aegosomatis]UPG84448.1 hypothetical protein L2Y94_13990 [Luteibacter aegosomatis]